MSPHVIASPGYPQNTLLRLLPAGFFVPMFGSDEQFDEPGRLRNRSDRLPEPAFFGQDHVFPGWTSPSPKGTLTQNGGMFAPITEPRGSGPHAQHRIGGRRQCAT
jgi:hypothetical protein